MTPLRPEKTQEQLEAVARAEPYTRAYRAVEIGSITTFLVLMGFILRRLAPHMVAHPWLMAMAVASGYLAADFVGGFFHWGADTWGTTKTFFVGNAMIRPFREHHADPKAMTKHDFIETNGTSCLMCMPGFVIPLWLPLGPGAGESLRIFIVAFFASLLIWMMCTNQFHKWAHADSPPAIAVLLQRARLILPPAHHAIHHVAPHSVYYCITNGWLNWVLTKACLFRLFERGIVAVLRWRPRQDEL